MIASSSYTHIVDPNQRWLAGMKVALTDDRLYREDDARFVEFDVGHAHRPVSYNHRGWFLDIVGKLIGSG